MDAILIFPPISVIATVEPIIKGGLHHSQAPPNSYHTEILSGVAEVICFPNATFSISDTSLTVYVALRADSLVACSVFITEMHDAFRNKPFVTKYWSDLKIKDQLIAASGKAYSDFNGSDESLTASFNAYYNLLPDATNPDSFNATQSLSREQFYTLMYKATNPVQDIVTVDGFSDAVGGETAYTKYASQVTDKGFLTVANKSLDGTNISGSITRAEAIYMVINNLFPDELAKVTGEEKSFDDIKNAGDLALNSGFKELIKVEGQKEKKLIEKDKWQAYSLAYSLQNPDKGIQDDLYKAMVVAKNLNLLGEGAESRWDESISKQNQSNYYSDASWNKINCTDI